MLNRAVLLGRLTKDPEMRYTPSGTAVTTFTLAIDRRMTNQQGERETDFLPIVVWSKLAELCAQYLKKGQQAAVEGRIQVRNYENKEGRRVYVTEIVAENVQFLSGGQGQGGEPSYAGGFDKPASSFGGSGGGGRSRDSFNDNPFADDQKPIDISDDDLPF
ncbi:single-stranded DNA-binding protein [Aneurinibacillus migulanus]|uniref:Single-stranded DNA-binding protein n=1 Tax=Aneurinibacillus migulanus TaxID=47500 RepID=A0A0D1XVU9_ANEMI|nr:single-stranded DNA-binding protein [Aneurinibacillus migulanus]KIV51177.1 single-stranded DNA-binding protein [Aneurinibacillus migulanus]KIV51360.1 single-stranded DNA-binding protein [Aneurinibacillus migulanus]KON93174.1 single-stranded DNA-binding protein [Aneurinibacillus migulanus]KPD09520.1 single-stranded DNA-binding protein [Aneurinibacillus migulanus]MCP1356706.1 single-stranded DNA-binding protein [Aneurinibacillus migulanus]